MLDCRIFCHFDIRVRQQSGLPCPSKCSRIKFHYPGKSDKNTGKLMWNLSNLKILSAYQKPTNIQQKTLKNKPLMKKKKTPKQPNKRNRKKAGEIYDKFALIYLTQE